MSGANDVDALVMPWMYSPACSPEIAVLRRICWGNDEAQEALDALNSKHKALRKTASNAVHSHCFGTAFDLMRAQDALEA